MRATASLWTDYAAAGGTRRGSIDLIAGTVLHRVNGESKLSARVPRARFVEIGAQKRDVIRIEWPEGAVEEWRLRKVVRVLGKAELDIEALPVSAELGTQGPIVQVVGSSVITQIAGSLRLSTWLSQHVIPHPAATRLGLVVGTLERDPVITLDLDGPSPDTLIIQAFAAAGLERVFTRTSESVWTLSGVVAVGSSAPTLVARPGVNVRQLGLTEDDTNVATVVVPFGAADPELGDRATIAELQFEVSTVAGDTLTMVDPDSGVSPIQVDSQWVGAYVTAPGLAPTAIVESRKDDGTVRVVSAAGISNGMRVGLVATMAGAPLLEVYDANGVLASPSRRVVSITVDGARGEENLVRNHDFRSGLAYWEARSGMLATRIPAAELGVTRTGAINGSRSPGTDGSTPLGLDGLPPNTPLFAGDRITVAGATYTSTAPAVAEDDGSITFAVTPDIDPAVPPGTPVAYQRVEARSLALAENHPVGAPLLVTTDSNTDNLPAFAGALALGGSLSGAAPATPLYLGGVLAGQAVLDVSAGGRSDPSPNAGLSVVTTATTVSLLASIDPTYTTLSVISPDDTPLDLAVGDYIAVGVRHALIGALPFSTWPSWLYEITALSMAGDSLSATATLSPWTMGGRVTVTPTPLTNYGIFFRRYRGTMNAGTATLALTHTREVRGAVTQGTAAVGTDTITLAPDANIAQRPFANGDVLTVERRTENVVMVYTAVTDGGTVGGESVAFVTLNAGASTIDDLPAADYTGSNEGACIINLRATLDNAALPARLVAIVAGVAELRSVYSVIAQLGSSGTRRGRCVATYDLNVTGSASFGNNAQATVTTSAVPTGVTLPRGARVWSNWHERAIYGDNTLMRLQANASAGATSVVVYGADGFRQGDEPTAGRACVAYQAPTGVTLPFPGEIVSVAADATANGSGAVSVTLLAANAVTLSDNTPISITRPALAVPGDGITAVLRMLGPHGNSFSTATPRVVHLVSRRVIVADGGVQTVTVRVEFALGVETYAGGELPAIGIVDTETGAILQVASLAAGTVQVISVAVATIALSVTLTSSTTVSVVLFGGSLNTARWVVARRVVFARSARDDVPFAEGSNANALALRGADVLAVRREAAPAVTLDFAVVRKWFHTESDVSRPVLGQLVSVPAVGLSRRLLAVERALTQPDRFAVEVGTVTTDQTRRVAALLKG